MTRASSRHLLELHLDGELSSESAEIQPVSGPGPQSDQRGISIGGVEIDHFRFGPIRWATRSRNLSRLFLTPSQG
jgi:hypothetical protein